MDKSYLILPSDYFWRGKENFEDFERTNDFRLLFYSALEYRNCIERILFDELYLLKIENLPRKFEKLYRAKELANTILEIEPDFIKKLEFINIYLEALGIKKYIFIPDLEFLNVLYGKLGNYLHTLKDPNKTIDNNDWWTGFIELINKCENYISKVVGSFMGSFDLNEMGNVLFYKWKNNELDKSDVIRKVRDEVYS